MQTSLNSQWRDWLFYCVSASLSLSTMWLNTEISSPCPWTHAPTPPSCDRADSSMASLSVTPVYWRETVVWVLLSLLSGFYPESDCVPDLLCTLCVYACVCFFGTWPWIFAHVRVLRFFSPMTAHQKQCCLIRITHQRSVYYFVADFFF